MRNLSFAFLLLNGCAGLAAKTATDSNPLNYHVTSTFDYSGKSVDVFLTSRERSRRLCIHRLSWPLAATELGVPGSFYDSTELSLLLVNGRAYHVRQAWMPDCFGSDKSGGTCTHTLTAGSTLAGKIPLDIFEEIGTELPLDPAEFNADGEIEFFFHPEVTECSS